MGRHRAARARHDHLLETAVEGGVEEFTAAIEEFQQKGIAPGSPAHQPKRSLAIQEHALSIKCHPEPPAQAVRAQALEGGIHQEPVEQEGRNRRPCGAHRNELGAAGGRQGGRVGCQAMHPDLLEGTGALVGFPPRLGGIDREQMAARRQGSHLHFRGHHRPRWLIIQLHHQMGTQAEGARIHQGPVGHLETEGPGTLGQNAFSDGGQDAHLRVALVQDPIQSLHPLRGGYLLKTLAGGPRTRKSGGRGGPTGEAPVQGKGWTRWNEEKKQQERSQHPCKPEAALPTFHAGSPHNPAILLKHRRGAEPARRLQRGRLARGSWVKLQRKSGKKQDFNIEN
jgi:hypothetical protein